MPDLSSKRRRTRAMTRSEIGRQVVLTVGSPQVPIARFRFAFALALKHVLNRLKRYNPDPKLVAVWKLGHAGVGVIQCEVAPPFGVLEPLPLPPFPKIALEANMVLGSTSVPDDEYYDDEWGLQKMSAEAAWSCAEMIDNPQPVTVAVLDSGISVDHPDLNPDAAFSTKSKSPRITGARVTVPTPDDQFEDEDGHGTFLAGTIAALTDNKIGVASPTWTIQDMLTIMAVKFYGPRTPLSSAFAARAIAWAVDHGAGVINASFHIGMSSQVLLDAVQYASDNDRVLVAAAGNDGTDNDKLPTWPASYPLPSVISVMATNRHDDKPGFSNYGPTTVHLAAPGVGIWSTHHYFYDVDDSKYRRYSGTSASSAYVAAAATLLRSLSPALTANEVREHLIKSVRPSEYLACVAQGWLDLEKAVCGPLRVTTPQPGQSWKKNTIVEVQWQADYDTPGCRTLSVLLSDNGGASYKYTLATLVDPSSGSCLVKLPNKKIAKARIKLDTRPGRFPARSGLFKIKN